MSGRYRQHDLRLQRNVSLQSLTGLDRPGQYRSSSSARKHDSVPGLQRHQPSRDHPKQTWRTGVIMSDNNRRMYIQADGRQLAFHLNQVRGAHVKNGDQVRFKVNEHGAVVILCKDKPPQQEEFDVELVEAEQPLSERENVRQRQKLQIPKQNSGRGYSDFSSSGAFHKGVIVHIKDRNAGFLKCISELPPGYSRRTNVYFRPNDVCSAGMKLAVGDILQFTLSTQDKNNPRAFHTSVVQFKRREEPVLNEYICLVENLLKGAENDSDASFELPERYNGMRSRTFLIELLKTKAAWKCLGNRESVSLETTKSLLELILRIESSSKGMNEAFSGVLNCLMESKLFNTRNGGIKSAVSEACRLQNSDMMKLFRGFFSLVFKYAPEQLSVVVQLIRPMVASDNNIADSQEAFLYYGLKQISKLFACQAAALDWNDVPLMPTPDELQQPVRFDHLFLSPVTNRYNSADDYLDTYFRLLRADCFDSFRTGIQDLLKGCLDPRDMNVYVNVSLVGIHVANGGDGLVVALHVNPQRPVRNWKTSSRFMFGNLLFISSSGNFKDGIFAVVSTRDADILNKHQIIFVELCGTSIGMDDSTALLSLTYNRNNMVIVECPTYYRAYKPILSALQTKEADKLPFHEQLIKGNVPEHVLPDYIDEEELSRMELYITENLDTSQEAAFRYALRNEVACIQGPPGTGKSYIGIKIVQLLLEMQCKPDSPILVITYKNHVLDEFVKEIRKIAGDGIVRVGGRSLESDHEEYNLKTLAKNTAKDPVLKEAIWEVNSELDEVMTRLKNSALNLRYARCVSHDTLIEYLEEEQLVSLLCGFDPTLKKQTALFISRVLKDNEASQEALNVLQSAYFKWCPPQDLIKQIEDDYYKNVTLDIGGANTEEENQQKKDDDDDLHDERDVEAIEKHRMVDGGGNQISLDKLIKFSANGGLKPAVKLVSADQAFVNSLPFWKLVNVKDLWSLNNRERFYLLQCLLVKQSSRWNTEFGNVLSEYKFLCSRKTELENQHKVDILSSKQVIGMTVVGASIYHDILMQVKPAIIIVEEAAEVLESQLIAILGSWVRHLIMIGDHQQLRPQVESYVLEKKYNFNLSMMERLIQCKLPYVTLKQQNRMLPEIAELLHDIYPNLESNMDRVSKHEKSASMEKCMFFWTHTDKETKGRSYSNEPEARRVVNLALYLVQQGHDPSSVTILSAYQGQVALLRRLMREAVKQRPQLFDPDQSGNGNNQIAIHTIDLYQGDENDIVIVSLVRSNEEQKAGFLKVINRRCVAQSRARCGMYLIGNAATLTKEDHWQRFISAMRERNCVGDAICFQCKSHPETKVLAATADDIPLDQSFCSVMCQVRLPCGKHSCTKRCQPAHSHKTCEFPCPKILACQHACTHSCYPDHDHCLCREYVDYVCSKCGHRGRKMCWQTEYDIACEAVVEFTFPCQHTGSRKCNENEADMKCKMPCTKKLLCGHPCTMKCHEACNNNSCKTCAEIKKMEEEKKLLLEQKRKQDEIDNAIEEARQEIERIVATGDLETKLEFLTEDSDSVAEYDKVKRLVVAGMPKPADREIHVKEIQKIVCPRLRKKCLEKKKKLIDPRVAELKFWNGNTENVEELEKSEFNFKPTTGPYGKGIYVTSNLTELAVTLEGDYHKTVIVEAFLGKAKIQPPSQGTSLCQLYYRGYDSLYTRSVTVGSHHVGDEFGLPAVSQIVPCYLVKYLVTESVDNPSVNAIELEALNGKSTEVQKFTLEPNRELQSDDPLNHELRQAESQFYRLLNRASDELRYQRQLSGLKFEFADYYVNPKLLKEFHQMKLRLMKERGPEYGRYILAFHGTKRENVDKIITNNFDPSKLSTGSGDKGWYGAGIYLSEYPQTSLSYGRALILCRVLPGKSYDMTPQDIRVGGKLQDGYDSHRVNVQEEGYGEEIVVFNPAQILPYCVVIYSTGKFRKEMNEPWKKGKKGKNGKKKNKYNK